VEKLCQAFENGAHLVDLTDQNPNVIANVLKLYLRQLPEPLFTFRLYSEFIRLVHLYNLIKLQGFSFVYTLSVFRNVVLQRKSKKHFAQRKRNRI